MSTETLDLNQLQKRLAGWIARVPPEALEFHKRCKALAEQIQKAGEGFGRRDTAQMAEIVRKSLDLEGDVPAIERMMNVARAAHAKVSELRTSNAPDARTRALVEDFSVESLTLIDFLVGRVSDRRAAAPATSQLQQIDTWAEDRRHALPVLDGIIKLVAGETDPGVKQSAETTLAAWMDDFARERTNAAWLEMANQKLRDLMSQSWSIRAKAKQEPPPLPQTVEPPKPEPPKPEPPKSAVEVETPPAESGSEEGSRITVTVISRALAECSDLVDALHYDRSGLRALDARLSQLRGRPGVAVTDLEALENDVGQYRLALQKAADEEIERLFRRLKLRSGWFSTVYGGREKIDEKVKRVESGKAEAASRLRAYIEDIQSVERLINGTVNSNRPLLANFVNRTLDECREGADALETKARTVEIDTSLAQIRSRIPAKTDSQMNADQLFEHLELCNSLRDDVVRLEEQNAARRDEVDAQIARLKKLAHQLTAVSDGGEIGRIAGRIPGEPPAARFLDETEADLNGIEQVLNGQLSKVRQQGTEQLLNLRQENQSWIRILSPLRPEVDKFTVSTPPPEDLDALRASIDMEKTFRESIARIADESAQVVTSRAARSMERLRHHLATPGFESHPEHETAQAIVFDLEALPVLPESPNRSDFDQAYQLVLEAEDSLERIEAAQRKIPDRLKELEIRVARLQSLNGTIYRIPIAQRLNILIAGIRQGIKREQWDYLEDQLDEANAIFGALQRDALMRISDETSKLVDKLRNVAKTSTDTVLTRQIENALKSLTDQDDIDPPSYSVRRRLQGFLGGRTTAVRR